MIEYIDKNKARFRVSIGSSSRGTRRFKTKTVTYNKKKELEQMYRDFEAECRSIAMPVGSVAELLERYRDTLSVKGIRDTTMRGYVICEKRINKVLGNIQANNLTTYQVDAFISSMAKSGLASKTIKNTISYLSSAYKHGIKTQMVNSNPCEMSTLPKMVAADIKIIEKDKLPEFVSALDEAMLDFKVCCELALYMGLRRSEVMGLTEEDINVNNHTLSINKTRHIVNGKSVIQPTKTERSNRTLAIPAPLLEDIVELIEEHHGNSYNNTNYLIQLFGEPMKPDRINDWLRKFSHEHGFDVTMHGLRHTFASMLNASGEFDIAEISSVLGHSNINTTLGIYTHVFQGTSKAAQQVATFMEKECQKGAK